MTEFRNPGRESSDSRRLLAVVTILIACLFFGVISRSCAALPHTREVKVERALSSDSGSMNVIERELFISLAFTQSIVVNWPGSWGWAIILLTAAINLLVLPLRIASIRSGVKMQRIEPDIKAIKARYKNLKLTDPQHNDMIAEIAKLQKDNGVTTFGGCLPSLIQMPLLLAFFGMLRKAADLRGAEWLWLHDLSSADPSHILPILMIVFQLLVQWYTALPGSDAKQQKIMACMMTIGFGYVSWHYAAGLALYTLTGSVLSMATQVAINCTPLGREMRELSARDDTFGTALAKRQ